MAELDEIKINDNMSDLENGQISEQEPETMELKAGEESQLEITTEETMLKDEEHEKRNIEERIGNFLSEKEVFLHGLFLGLLPSMYDVTTDILMINDFIRGANYLHIVYNPNDSQVEGCEFVENQTCTFYSLEKGSHTSTTFTFRCFERDPIFGWVSLAIMFFPAMKMATSKLFKCSTKFVFFFTFPLALILVRIAKLFTKDKLWKERSEEMGVAEGKFESLYQLCVQLFIVFTMAHRQPSRIQIATMFGSIFVLTKIAIEEKISKDEKHDREKLEEVKIEEQPSKDEEHENENLEKLTIVKQMSRDKEHEKKNLEERIGVFVKFIPYFASFYIATSLTISLQVAILRYNYLWVVFFVVMTGIVEGVAKKCKRCTIKIPKIPFLDTNGFLTMKFAKMIIPNAILLIFIILANLNYDHVLSTFYPFAHTTYSLNSMPIIHDIERFNWLVGVIFSLKIFSCVLWYFQIRTK